MKVWKIIKFVLYNAAGVAILVFNHPAMSVVGYIVGAVILAYGLEPIVVGASRKKLFKENSALFDGLINILLAATLFIVSDDIIKICLIWAVWSIIREGRELAESAHHIREKRPGLTNLIESVVIIVFSFTMILEPGEHHAHVHVIILGIELILEVMFPLLDPLYDRILISLGKAPVSEEKPEGEGETTPEHVAEEEPATEEEAAISSEN